MRKYLWGVCIFFVLGVFVSGCGTTGIEMRSYTEDKPRVDQDIGEGNAGYLSGTSHPEDRSQYKKTRKTYVLEISKGAGEIPPAEEESYTVPSFEEPPSRPRPLSAGMDVIVLPSEGQPRPKAVPHFVEYTVEKDDTLQKISKKFYGSYGKWSKIYEANKSVIRNPDRIQPGIVIQIPMP
jgi:nucleoid-associated protein YgaU